MILRQIFVAALGVGQGVGAALEDAIVGDRGRRRDYQDLDR